MKLRDLKKVENEDQLSTWIQKNCFGKDSSYKGNTLLHLAVYTKNLKIVQMVHELYNFKLVDKENEKGLTPKDLADKLNLLDIVFWLENPNLKLYKSRDPYKEFYENLNKRGHSSQQVFGLIDVPKNEIIKKHRVNHIRGSGRSTYNYYATKYNVPHIIDFFKYNDYLSFVLKPINFIKMFFKGPRPYPWKNFEFKKHENLKLNFITMSKEDSVNIKKYIKSKRLHLIMYGLICADKVLKNRLLKSEIDSEWLIANSYSLVKKPYAEGYNDMSFVPVELESGTVLEKSLKLKKSLKKSFIWGNHYRMNYEVIVFNFLNKYFPRLVDKMFTENKSRFASLSFFGESKLEIEDPIVLGKVTPHNFCNIHFFMGASNSNIVLMLDINDSVRNGENIDDILKEIAQEMINSAV